MPVTDDLITDIQYAVDHGLEDVLSKMFLDYIYLKKDLLLDAFPFLINKKVLYNIKDVNTTQNSCRQLEVGSEDRPKETRFHKHGPLDYRFETRSVNAIAYIKFCHPTINEIWDDVRGCAITAAVSAVVVAILSGNIELAKALFYPSFYACLVSKIGERAKEVEISLFEDKELGCWENHCA
ncbi:MAG: hypothetical protein ACYDG2_11600 [Ruminiclostridium sp.]